MPDHDRNGSLPAGGHALAPVELSEVTEQLLLAGLRQHALTDQLQRQLAFSRAIAASMTDGVCTLDRAGRITFINAAAERLLGWLDADVRGLEASAVFQDPDTARGSDAIPPLAVLRSGIPYRSDQALFRRRDGTNFPVAYSAAPLVVDDRVEGVVVAFDDVTDVQRLRQIQEEYLALVSHDLRTPLTTIMGFATLLLNQLTEATLERAARSAEAIVRSGETMERMLQDALDHSRLQGDPGALRLVPLDLVEVVTRGINQNMLPAERARIAVETVVRLPIMGDAIGMERVIVNLLTNACKYSAPASPVVVRVFRSDHNALISVTDHGVGVDTDDLSHLFEKHYRAKTAGTTKGSGLGLFGSRQIVEAHGGSIWAESTVGEGSTFTVSIPATELSPRAHE